MHTKSLLQLFLIYVMAPGSMLWGQNYSLSFDGVDDYVQLPEISTELGQPNSSITTSLWFKKPSSNTSNYHGLLVHASVAGGTIFTRIEASGDNKICYYHRNSSSNNEAASNNTFELDEWNNVVYVINGISGEIDVYINGILDDGSHSTFDPNESYFADNRSWQIGNANWTSNGTHAFNGQIDNLSIWNTALTQEQIQSYMSHHQQEVKTD